MSKEVGKRARAPEGYYSQLVSGKMEGKEKEKEKSNMAESGELEIKSKNKVNGRKKSSVKGSVKSRASSKRSVNSQADTKTELESRADDFEGEDKNLSEEEMKVDEMIDELRGQSAHSRILHQKAMHGDIQFVEDWEVPEDLAKETVWELTHEQHKKELGIVEDRIKRLSKMEELLKIKDEIRTKRLSLMTKEKELEMEEKRKQMQAQKDWMLLQQREHALHAEWEEQQLRMERMLSEQRVKGWVAASTEHVTKGDLGSIKSESKGKVTGKYIGADSVGISGGLKPDRQTVSKKEQKDNLLPAHASGVEHLRRMGMLPAYGVGSEVSMEKLPVQDKGRQKRDMCQEDIWDFGSRKEEAGKKNDVQLEGAGGGKVVDGKNKIKSGKWAKSHRDLVREETWPHAAVLRQYTKRTTFDQMEFEPFVAGETRIILAMMQKDQEKAMGRLKVLCRVSHWLCKCKDWPAVKSMFEAIIESVEMGESEWTSSFDYMEGMLPPAASVLEKLREKPKEKDEKFKEKEGKKSVDVYWCKEYQKGQCNESGSHLAQLKPDEKPVWVAHICATCWQKDKKKREHQEADLECPHKKA